MPSRRHPSSHAVLLAAVLLSLCASGCALQLEGAYRTGGQRTGRFGALVSTHMLRPRGSGIMVGARAAVSDPAPEPGLRLRSVTLAAGYRAVFHPFAWELGGETGVGAPLFTTFEGTGVYVGLTTAALWRISGEQDHEVGFAPGALLVDLVVTGHAGLWSPPLDRARIDERADWGISAGVRFSGISDLFAAGNDGWAR